MESPHAPPMDDQGASSPTPQGRWMAARAVSNRLARLRKPRKALRASASRARIGRRYRETRIAAFRLKGRQAKTCTLNAERPARGTSPCGPSSALIEKRPPRARRPALPQPGAAVLSAKAGLTAGFGMGPGDPRLCGRARGGRSPAALMYGACQEPRIGATLAAAWRAREKITHRARCLSSRMRRARAISAARLSASPRLHLRPIDQVVYLGPYRRVDSSRRRLPA